MAALVQFLETFLRKLIELSALFLLVMLTMGLLRRGIAPLVARMSRNALGRRSGGILTYLLPLAGGMVTPFCSCSAVPMAIGMLEASVPLGAVVTFLVASPVIHEGTILLLWVTSGAKAALWFTAVAALIALVIGLIFGQLKLDHLIYRVRYQAAEEPLLARAPLREKLKVTVQMTLMQLKRLWPYLLLGVLVGALLEDFVPTSMVERAVRAVGPLGVVIATLIGVPIYARIEALIPIAAILISRGVPIGTALAFVMACSVLSLPEMILLSRLFKPRLLAAYIASVTLAIVLMGYGFNLTMTGRL